MIKNCRADGEKICQHDNFLWEIKSDCWKDNFIEVKIVIVFWKIILLLQWI